MPENFQVYIRAAQFMDTEYNGSCLVRIPQFRTTGILGFKLRDPLKNINFHFASNRHLSVIVKDETKKKKSNKLWSFAIFPAPYMLFNNLILRKQERLKNQSNWVASWANTTFIEDEACFLKLSGHVQYA